MSGFNIALNMFIVSLPESFIMTLIALLIMRRFDYIDKYTIGVNFRDIILKVALPFAVFTTLTFYILELDIYIRTVVNTIGFNIFTIFLLKGEKKMKIFAATFMSITVMLLTEMITWLILIYIFNVNMDGLNISALLNFVISSPFRILQAGILYIIYIRKNDIFKVTIYKLWNKNKLFRRFFIAYIAFNLFIFIYIYNNFAVNKCLKGLATNVQLSIAVTILIIMVVEVILPWVLMYIVHKSQNFRNLSYDK